MTVSIDTEVRRRREALEQPPSLVDGFVYMAHDLRRALLGLLVTLSTITWPSERYRNDPIAFGHDILGVQAWSRQVELIEAVRDNARVACRSGHRVAKSHTAAWVALWWFATQRDGRVILTSRTARQVEEVLWLEVRKMHARAGRCFTCKRDDPEGPTPCAHSARLDGKPASLASTGLETEDFREIVGYTAKEADAITGVAGRRLLFIVDESASVPDTIFEGIQGNRAGGAKLLLLGNPTRNAGELYEAFEGKKKDFYTTLTISSEESPNVTAGHEVIEGLATADWVDEMKREYGEDSPFYTVRVRGRHALREEGKIFSIHTITEAQLRWNETDAEGRLVIGLDPAGIGESGDESAFSMRRGLRQIALTTFRGLSPEAHLAHLLGFIKQHGIKREVPVVVLDAEGKIGSEVHGAFITYLRTQKSRPFELIPIRASNAPLREPMVYDRLRDELTAGFNSWLRDGGAIVDDAKLAKEMHECEWLPHRGGRIKLIDKVTLRKKLGRSPDRYDATVLSAWWQADTDRPEDEPEDRRARRDTHVAVSPYEGAIDPYGGSIDPWGPRR